MKQEIQLGDTARDTITGFTGVVVARTQWLNNCDRLTLQPRELKDGKPIDTVSFDVMSLELIETKTAREKPAPKTGGPMPEPTR